MNPGVSIREELDVLQRQANRPARLLFILTTLALVAAYVPVTVLLAQAAIPEPLYRTLTPLLFVGPFLLTQWLVSAWPVRRFRRLTGKWQAARDAA